MMMYPFGMAWGGVWGALWMLLLLALTVLGGVALVRALLPRPPDRTQDDPALDALRIQFAHGEIDEETYVRRRNALARTPRGAQP